MPSGPPPASKCFLPGPWQASHCRPPGPKGARLSARLACLVLKIANTGNSPPSTWHIRQVSAPVSVYSVPMLGGAAGGSAALSAGLSAAAAPNARPDSSAANTSFLIVIVVCPLAMVLVDLRPYFTPWTTWTSIVLPGPWQKEQASGAAAAIVACVLEKMPPLPA